MHYVSKWGGTDVWGMAFRFWGIYTSPSDSDIGGKLVSSFIYSSFNWNPGPLVS